MLTLNAYFRKQLPVIRKAMHNVELRPNGTLQDTAQTNVADVLGKQGFAKRFVDSNDLPVNTQ